MDELDSVKLNKFIIKINPYIKSILLNKFLFCIYIYIKKD